MSSNIVDLVGSDLDVEALPEGNALGCWASASCPASTASSASTASTAGQSVNWLLELVQISCWCW